MHVDATKELIYFQLDPHELQSRLFSPCPTGLESVDGTTVLGKLDWHFIRGKQLSNNFTAVAIAIAILTQETPAAAIGVLLLSTFINW